MPLDTLAFSHLNLLVTINSDAQTTAFHPVLPNPMRTTTTVTGVPATIATIFSVRHRRKVITRLRIKRSAIESWEMHFRCVPSLNTLSALRSQTTRTPLPHIASRLLLHLFACSLHLTITNQCFSTARCPTCIC